MDDRKWALAWAKLNAFRTHLPNEIQGSHVGEYHEILDLLQDAAAEDLSSFRIKDDQQKPKVLGYRRATRRQPAIVYRSDSINICDHNLMIRQLEALVAYFNNISPPERRKGYGFEQ